MFVMGAEKTLARLLSGTSDAGIRFDDLCRLLESLGFEKRVSGSHHLFRKARTVLRRGSTCSATAPTQSRTRSSKSGWRSWKRNWVC